MITLLRKSLFITVLLAILLCGVYPLVVTGIAQIVFPSQSNGSLVIRDGKTIGSRLIGQNFRRPEYFHSRPSAAGDGYDAANSSGSNLGPTSSKLVERLSNDAASLLKENPGLQKGQIPADMLTTSASGLDPDISVQAAMAQIRRVAGARGASAEKIEAIVRSMTKGRVLGFLGEERVNVLALNLELDTALKEKSVK
jgi:K+-transporting ATPase ATPase C chain